MQLKFVALPTPVARAYQTGGVDANQQIPERAISDGGGNPCRHCLTEIPAGKEMLVLAHRPFPELQPYAESGPIFLCADECERHQDSTTLPKMFHSWNSVLIKGYTPENRIQYGTGVIVPVEAIETNAQAILERQEVAYVHMRSATNNCYLGRIERG